MRMRIVTAAVVLGLGIVGITLAQQAGEEQQSEKAKARARVIGLSVDVELLELDHDANRPYLLGLMKDMREQVIRVGERAMSFGGEEVEKNERAIEEAEQKKLDQARPEELERILIKVTLERAERRRQIVEETIKSETADPKALLNRKRTDFARLAAKLAEKRLELAEAERRYNEAK